MHANIVCSAARQLINCSIPLLDTDFSGIDSAEKKKELLDDNTHALEVFNPTY